MRSRHTLLALAATVAANATTLAAQSALRPAPSTRATSEVALTYPDGAAPEGAKPAVIKLDYGQPHLRGRTLHTDSLVPYDTPWRTGANSLTKLESGVDLVIGGATVPKGTYFLYTLPSRAGWKLIIQRDAGQTPQEYSPTHDIARIDLRRSTLASPVESFTMWLIPSLDSSAARGELRMAWGTTALSTDWTVK